jgi:hypothetical protein
MEDCERCEGKVYLTSNPEYFNADKALTDHHSRAIWVCELNPEHTYPDPGTMPKDYSSHA